ncbi:MAG: hypothetical protein NWR72_16295 [Bacteroidia bacterium]|nr:hypothetical protein [Bacteroidia bacterium]
MRHTFLLIGLILGCTMTQAQTFGKAEYEQLKSLTIENLERDSYVVFEEEGYILDRYELKPAYVFNFSDEIERKVSLYLVYPLESEDTLASVMFYQREDLTIVLPLPGANADREAWGLYIDDLKYVGEDEPGFLACVGFVVSKEFSALLAGSAGGQEEEGEYEYCFAAKAMIQVAEGREIPVAEIIPGMEIMSWDHTQNDFTKTIVTGIDIHLREEIEMYEIWMTDPAVLLADNLHQPVLKRLYLTPNHPVETESGIMRADEIQTGMQIFIHENGKLIKVPVMAARVSHSSETTVYSIITEDMPFFVERILVWPK